MSVRMGDIGKAISSLHPQGVVQLGGQRYQARAEHSALEIGSAVVVVGGDNCGLIVRGADTSSPPSSVPRFGETVSCSFLERISSQIERDDSAQQLLEADQRRRGMKVSSIVGAIAATIVLFMVWESITEQPGPTWQFVVFASFGGAALGTAVFLNLRGILGQFDRGSGRLTELCTALALLGAAGGAILGIPTFGLAGGISLALVGMFALGLAIPMLLVIGQEGG